MSPNPKALRPPKPLPPPPPPGVLPMARYRRARFGNVKRVRVRRPWYLLGLVQFVTFPREGLVWGGR